MLLIIEGHDLSGKTTITELLLNKLKRYKFTKKKMKVNKLDSIEKQSIRFNSELEKAINQNKNIILDRGLLSSLIYSKYFDRPDDVSYIDSFLERCNDNIYIVVLYCDSDTIKERYTERSDAFFDLTDILGIKSEYLYWYNHNKHKYKHTKLINTTYKSREVVVDEIYSWMWN